VSEEHLIQAIAGTYAKMPQVERIKKVRELVRKSASNKDFLKKFFPDMYREAYPNG
jgi:hypothetical protein